MKLDTQLTRRTLLQGAGVALSLPWLEAMAGEAADRRPKRAVFLYFPNGCYTDTWFPAQIGENYELSPALDCLTPHKSQLTVLRGLRLGLPINAHAACEYYLSCCPEAGGYGNKYRNSISVDQVIGEAVGDQTRFPSLVMGNDAGVGRQHRANTMSYDPNGRPIPVQATPKEIFTRLFVDESASRQQREHAFAQQRSILDAVKDRSRELERDLGKLDREKLDEYLTAVRAIERRVQQSERWMSVPKPQVDPTGLELEATVDDPINYVDTMLDIIFLALQTDQVRVAAYVMSREQFGSMQNLTMRLGISDQGHHAISHAGQRYAKEWTKVDQFFAGRLRHFLDRMKDCRDGAGSLLDNTLVVYGGGNSTKHNMNDLPTVLAGGTSLGFKHGRHLSPNRTLDDLWLTVLQQMDLPAETFAASRGPISELLV